jgi:hypothetical protein
VLFAGSSKKFRILRFNKCKKKKKPIAVFKKKKERATAPASTADPKKVQKVDFDFCQFFFDFCVRLLDAVQKLERLIVQKWILELLNRVMTQNRIALFKPRPL